MKSTLPDQTCWECREFGIDYEGDWSDVTPGAGLQIDCAKDHYHLSNSVTEREFAEAMTRGFTCPDFVRRSVR